MCVFIYLCSSSHSSTVCSFIPVPTPSGLRETDTLRTRTMATKGQMCPSWVQARVSTPENFKSGVLGETLAFLSYLQHPHLHPAVPWNSCLWPTRRWPLPARSLGVTVFASVASGQSTEDTVCAHTQGVRPQGRFTSRCLEDCSLQATLGLRAGQSHSRGHRAL